MGLAQLELAGRERGEHPIPEISRQFSSSNLQASVRVRKRQPMGFRGWPTQPSRLVMVVAPRCSSSAKYGGKKKKVKSEEFKDEFCTQRGLQDQRPLLIPWAWDTRTSREQGLWGVCKGHEAQSSHHTGCHRQQGEQAPNKKVSLRLHEVQQLTLSSRKTQEWPQSQTCSLRTHLG